MLKRDKWGCCDHIIKDISFEEYNALPEKVKEDLDYKIQTRKRYTYSINLEKIRTVLNEYKEFCEYTLSLL